MNFFVKKYAEFMANSIKTNVNNLVPKICNDVPKNKLKTIYISGFLFTGGLIGVSNLSFVSEYAMSPNHDSFATKMMQVATLSLFSVAKSFVYASIWPLFWPYATQAAFRGQSSFYRHFVPLPILFVYTIKHTSGNHYFLSRVFEKMRDTKRDKGLAEIPEIEESQ